MGKQSFHHLSQETGQVGLGGLQCPLDWGQDCRVLPGGGSLASAQQVGPPPSPPPGASPAAQKPLTLERLCPWASPPPSTVVLSLWSLGRQTRVRTWLIVIPQPTLVLRRHLTPESPLNGFLCQALSVAAGGQAQLTPGGRRTLGALVAK